MTTERAKDFKGTLRQLLRAMNRYKLSMAVVVVFAILSTIFNIAGPKVLAKATTALATGWVAKLRGTGGIDFGYIGRISNSGAQRVEAPIRPDSKKGTATVKTGGDLRTK